MNWVENIDVRENVLFMGHISGCKEFKAFLQGHIDEARVVK
jgi:hypothetical protein